jgi:hypothetical protein
MHAPMSNAWLAWCVQTVGDQFHVRAFWVPVPYLWVLIRV